jgi:folate-dependent tRNA-U54 methylase TrmFO/GidA
MENLTYKEYVEQLNQAGLYRMLSNMTEVPSMEEAQKASQVLLDSIVDTCGLSKAKIRKANYALAEVKIRGSNYLAFLYNINGAQVMLRATDLTTKKFYIPNDVWIAATNKSTEETELQLVMSLSMTEQK